MHIDAVLTEVNQQLGRSYSLVEQLSGGSQNGAFLMSDGSDDRVLKWQEDPNKASYLLAAKSVIDHAVFSGWPVARWFSVGVLSNSAAFLVQEYIQGESVDHLEPAEIEAIIRSNALQARAGLAEAFDDSAHIKSVIDGVLLWKQLVANHSSSGAALIAHAEQLLAQLGDVSIPTEDVVHGDYSTGNMLLSADRSMVRFIDSETVRKGTRARDLADLLRQTYIYGAPVESQALLLSAGQAIAGPKVFAKCAVAVTIDNLAWWVANQPRAKFDAACVALHGLFDAVRTNALAADARLAADPPSAARDRTHAVRHEL